MSSEKGSIHALSSDKGSVYANERAEEKYQPNLPSVEDEDLYQRDVHDAPLKLGPDGLPLIPQPSSHPDDPLNYPRWLKWLILFQVSALAFLASFNIAVGNPAFVIIGRYFGITTVQATYPASISIALAGVGSFVWVPLAQCYGRRPVYIISSIITVVTTAAAGAVDSYGALIALRAIAGFSISASNALGAAVLADVFFLHERGVKFGIYTVCLTNGAHLASLPGGYLAEYVGWRWTLYMPAIVAGFMLCFILAFLPETLYVRTPEAEAERVHSSSLIKKLNPFPKRAPGRHLHAAAFFRPLQLVMKTVVPIVAFYYSLVFAWGSVLPAITVSKLFHELYGFGAARIGLCLSLSTTIGGVLGEFLAGPVIDKRMMANRKREGHVRAEYRLWGALPGVILLPIGLVIFGCCIHFETSYIGPCVGMALTCMAVQICTTSVYSYLTDCYKSQAGECSQILNFARQTQAFPVGFYAIEFGDAAGFWASGLTYALITLLAFCPVLYIIFKGESIRNRQGAPTWDKGI